MVTEVKQTVLQWLEELANTNESGGEESAQMQNLLRHIGFSNAVCTCGIVYLEGHGTIVAPPMSIHSIAKMLLKAK